MKTASKLLQKGRVLVLLAIMWAWPVPARADLTEILKESSGELWEMAMLKRAELKKIADDPDNPNKNLASDILWLSSCGAWPFTPQNLLEALLSHGRSNGYMLQNEVPRPDNENDRQLLAQMLLKGNVARWREQEQSSPGDFFNHWREQYFENFTFWDVILDGSDEKMAEYIRTKNLGWFVLQYLAGGYKKRERDRWDIAAQELKKDRWGLRNGPPPAMPFPDAFVRYLIVQDRMDDACLLLQARRQMTNAESSNIWLARIHLLQGTLPAEIKKWDLAWEKSKTQAQDAVTLAWLHYYAGHAPESQQWLERSGIEKTHLHFMLDREQFALERDGPLPLPDLDKIFAESVESGNPDLRGMRQIAIEAARAKWDGDAEWITKFRRLKDMKLPDEKYRQPRLATLYTFGCWDEILPYLQTLGHDDFIFDFGKDTPKWREAVNVAEEQIKKYGVAGWKHLSFRLLSYYTYTLGNDTRAKELYIEFLQAHPKEVFDWWYASQINAVGRRLGLLDHARAVALSAMENADEQVLFEVLPLFLPPDSAPDTLYQINLPLLLQAVRQARPGIPEAECRNYLMKLVAGNLPREESLQCLRNFGLSLLSSEGGGSSNDPRNLYMRSLLALGWTDLGMELIHAYKLTDVIDGRSRQLSNLDSFMDRGLWPQAMELAGYYFSSASILESSNMFQYSLCLLHMNRLEEGRRYLRLVPYLSGDFSFYEIPKVLAEFKKHLPELLPQVEIMAREEQLPTSRRKGSGRIHEGGFNNELYDLLHGNLLRTDENLMRWLQLYYFAKSALIDYSSSYAWPGYQAEYGAAIDLGWGMHHAARYLELSPDARKTPEGRAHYDDALQHFRASGELAPMSSVLLWKRWHAFLLETGDAAGAKTVYEQARRMPDDMLAAYPHSPAAKLFIGQLDFATGHDPKNALAMATSLLADEPNNFAAMLLLLRATKQIDPPSFPDLLKKAQARHPRTTWEEFMEQPDLMAE